MGYRSRLPGTPEIEQIVCHVDIDCFYAACERLREPALRDEPVVVGMGYELGSTAGAVATASYEARSFGVESGQSITEALELLPRKVNIADKNCAVEAAGFYRPVDMAYYESVSDDIKERLSDRATVLREMSIDEAYMDVTDQTEWSNIRRFARAIKEDISREIGVTASVGIAPTMSAAKVASDHDKPDGLVIVEPGDVSSFFAPLDVQNVHGVGPITATQLRNMGIETAGELAEADPIRLEAAFGERGRRIHRFARGEDDRTVEPKGQPKSFSRESAFEEATTDVEQQRDRVRTLASAVTDRTSPRDVLYQTIGIKVVTPPFDIQTRARSLPGPISDPDLVDSISLALFSEFEGDRVRKLGVRVSNLSFADEEQPTLAAWTDHHDSKGDNDASKNCRQPGGQQSLNDFE